jgi:hypothetical protein
MAKPLTPFTISAPGFMGLNTQDAPIDLSQNFALTAENIVIDKFGRVGARKGWIKVSNNTNANLGTNNITSIGEVVTNDGVSTIVAAGGGFLFKLVGATLTTLTYGGGGVAPTISANNWQFCQLNGVGIFWQRGYDPLIYDPAVSTTTFRRLSEKSGAAGSIFQCHIGISAYGRVWAADIATDKSTVVWSDVLTPQVWTGGTAGSLDLRTVWKGGDTIVGLAAHNNFLYIFGKTQILVYANANDPAVMSLSDTITGIGAIGRDTIQNTGKDVVFMSTLGVVSMARTIQEKSQPIRDISINIRNDVISAVLLENPDNLKAVFNGVESIYFISIPLLQYAYVFDMRQVLENGAGRATTWVNLNPACAYTANNGTLYFGQAGCIAKYSGYLDNTSTYQMRYYTPWIDFGSPVMTSIFKKAIITVIGVGAKQIITKWSFDYLSNKMTSVYTDNSTAPAEYGTAEYGLAEYSGSSLSAIEVKVPGAGHGKVLQIGIEALINNRALSIQRIDVFAKDGRI